MPSFFAYFYPSMLLPAVLFLRAHDSLHFITGLLMLVYLSLMTPFALRVYRLIDESIKLRFENLGLIGELREQRTLPKTRTSPSPDSWRPQVMTFGSPCTPWVCSYRHCRRRPWPRGSAR
jgi:hypothetical protein